MHTPNSMVAQRPGATLLAGLLTLAAGILPLSATAAPPPPQPTVFGTYFLTDDALGLAGGGVLYSDCTQDGGLIGAIPVRGGRSVMKFTPTSWVNDPDPTLLPYSRWEVPAELLDMPRLFLCYSVQNLGGVAIPMTEFCDWLPRDLKGPVEFDYTHDGVRDLLVTVDYHDRNNGARKQCGDQ